MLNDGVPWQFPEATLGGGQGWLRVVKSGSNDSCLTLQQPRSGGQSVDSAYSQEVYCLREGASLSPGFHQWGCPRIGPRKADVFTANELDNMPWSKILLVNHDLLLHY